MEFPTNFYFFEEYPFPILVELLVARDRYDSGAVHVYGFLNYPFFSGKYQFFVDSGSNQFF